MLDKGGQVLTDPVHRRRIDELIADGTICGGMLPKIAARWTRPRPACAVHIIDGRCAARQLLLEILTETGLWHDDPVVIEMAQPLYYAGLPFSRLAAPGRKRTPPITTGQPAAAWPGAPINALCLVHKALPLAALNAEDEPCLLWSKTGMVASGIY